MRTINTKTEKDQVNGLEKIEGLHGSFNYQYTYKNCNNGKENNCLNKFAVFFTATGASWMFLVHIKWFWLRIRSKY